MANTAATAAGLSPCAAPSSQRSSGATSTRRTSLFAAGSSRRAAGLWRTGAAPRPALWRARFCSEARHACSTCIADLGQRPLAGGLDAVDPEHEIMPVRGLLQQRGLAGARREDAGQNVGGEAVGGQPLMGGVWPVRSKCPDRERLEALLAGGLVKRGAGGKLVVQARRDVGQLVGRALEAQLAAQLVRDLLERLDLLRRDLLAAAEGASRTVSAPER